MSWHAHEETIDAYVSGRIDEASAISLETHLLACTSCRGAISTRVDVDRRERIWNGLRAMIDRPRLRLVERALIRLGVPAHTARLLVATPSLRTSWLLGVAATLVFAVVASRGIAGAPLPFLLLAPLVPLMGVATAFGQSVDPAWEIGLASPTGGFRLMLIRATGVLVTSAGLAGLATLALPELGWGAAAWLLPSLALTVLTLVLSSTAASVTTAASIVGVGWLTGVTVVERLSSEPLAAFGPTAQVAFAVLAAASTAVLAGRHDAFERPTRV